jgi:hypothetical protein
MTFQNVLIVKLRNKIRDFKYFLLAFDKSTEISDSAQLVVFLREVNDTFQVTEERLNLI